MDPLCFIEHAYDILPIMSVPTAREEMRLPERQKTLFPTSVEQETHTLQAL